MIKVKRALISVADKAGLLDFARGLNAFGIEIISTGGTAKHLKNAGIPVKEVSDYTGFPEILEGRVKTLHPAIHGGLLALRGKQEHMAQLKKHHIGPIDMVVVNLYPFARVTQKKNITFAEAAENLDIGGPAMLRSAAKNFTSVAVVCNPKRYRAILKELEVNSGLLSDTVLANLAIEAFHMTALYDTHIYHFLSQRFKSDDFAILPKEIALHFTKKKDLRYGENPHQAGAFYADAQEPGGLAKLKQLNGKELSFNNLLDLNAAVDFIKDFKSPAAVIIKHTNPTGIAQDKSLTQAFQAALDCDPVSAFGGIIGLNKKVDLKTVKAISQSGFMECVIAPGYEAAALKLLKAKKNLRVIELNLSECRDDRFDFKKIHGGLLLQDTDTKTLEAKDFKIVSKKKPSAAETKSLVFGWKVIKNIKSNAILIVKGTKTIGVGCGQTSRIDSTMLALKKAGKNTKGAVMISDAFLPKTDNVKTAAKAGIKAIIHSGGSIQDEAVIKEANRARIALVSTGVRHFKH